MVDMPSGDVGRVVKGTAAGGREVARRASRAVGTARTISGAGNRGLMRLADLHAASSAGDTLVMMGLVTTIFFAGPVDQARVRVALALLLTMAPFAVLAPLIGPVLDRFRHGRRFALATTMLGRAALAWVISATIDEVWLYVAAFGAVFLSRTYSVARSATLPRLLPQGLRLSQASARAAVFGAGAAVLAAGLGAIGLAFGPQWPPRFAILIYVVGAVVALNLPTQADADSDEALPQQFGLPWRMRIRLPDGSTAPVLSGQSVSAAVLGSAGLRALYGFLLLFLAFAIRAETVPAAVLGVVAGPLAQLVLVGAAFGVGTLLATVLGTALRISRPVRLQAVGVVLVGLAGILATLRFSLFTILVLCFATALASGLAKVAVDATLQHNLIEAARPTAFARAETLLMLAWVAGAALGLVPFLGPRLGLAIATASTLVATVLAAVAAWRARGQTLLGHPPQAPGAVVTGVLLHRDPAGGSATIPAQPPAPAAPYALPPAPAQPPALPAQPPAVPAQPPAVPPAPTALEAPPGFHVFRPSPPLPPDQPPTQPSPGAGGPA